MKLAKIMLFCSFVVIITAIISCNQEQEDPALYGIHKYQKDLRLETQEGLILEVTVSGNDEEIVNSHTENFFIINPIYELPQASSDPNAVERDTQFDGQPMDEESNLIVVTINKRILPVGAIGFTINEDDNLLRWDKLYAYDSECDCAFIYKLNSNGNTRGKVGIKTGENQWFYEQIYCGKLKTAGLVDICPTGPHANYLKMRLRRDNNWGSSSLYGFYNENWTIECP